MMSSAEHSKIVYLLLLCWRPYSWRGKCGRSVWHAALSDTDRSELAADLNSQPKLQPIKLSWQKRVSRWNGGEMPPHFLLLHIAAPDPTAISASHSDGGLAHVDEQVRGSMSAASCMVSEMSRTPLENENICDIRLSIHHFECEPYDIIPLFYPATWKAQVFIGKTRKRSLQGLAGRPPSLLPLPPHYYITGLGNGTATRSL